MAQGPAFDFESEWPQLENHLRGVLGHHRVPGPVRDDIIQETGVRLWKLRGRVDPARSVRSLVSTIALNLLRDHVRRERHLSYGTDLFDMKMPGDIEEEVVARDELRRARWAWAALSTNYQRALLASVYGYEGDHPVSASARMMKMRARKQLRLLMENVTRAKAGCGLLAHKAWDAIAGRLNGFHAIRGEQLAHVAGAAVMLVAISISPSLTTQPEAGSRDVTPPRASTASLDEVVAPERLSPSSDEARLIVAAARHKERTIERKEMRKVLARIGPVTYYQGRSVASGTFAVELGNAVKTAGALASVEVKSLSRRAPSICGLPTGGCKDRARR